MLDAVLAALPEVVVRRWRGLPQPVLLLPNTRRWLILVDAGLDEGEQSLHILHQIKHALDAPDRAPGSCEGDPVRTLHCYRFATNVLVPSDRLRRDLANNGSDAEGLARHYGVPVAAMRQQIRELGLMEGGKV